MKKAIIYVHGKGGNAAEAEYDELANRYDEMGECQRRRAEKQKKDPCKLRRNAIVEYLCFVRNNPIKWDVKTAILYVLRSGMPKSGCHLKK